MTIPSDPLQVVDCLQSEFRFKPLLGKFIWSITLIRFLGKKPILTSVGCVVWQGVASIEGDPEIGTTASPFRTKQSASIKDRRWTKNQANEGIGIKTRDRISICQNGIWLT